MLEINFLYWNLNLKISKKNIHFTRKGELCQEWRHVEDWIYSLRKEYSSMYLSHFEYNKELQYTDLLKIKFIFGNGILISNINFG